MTRRTRTTGRTQPAQQAQQAATVQEVKGIPIPPAAAERIMAAVAAAQAAQERSAAIIEAVLHALGAPAGSNLVQTQDDGALYFMPPAQPQQEAQGKAAGQDGGLE